MSSGDLASTCERRLSIGKIQGHTPWVFHWDPRTSHVETNYKIVLHNINDGSQIFWAVPLGVHCLNSPGVGHLNLHIMVHIFTIHCGLPSHSPAFESTLASG